MSQRKLEKGERAQELLSAAATIALGIWMTLMFCAGWM